MENLKEKLLKMLCHYDARNPDCCHSKDDNTIRKKDCDCINCVFGFHEKAERYLKYLK